MPSLRLLAAHEHALLEYVAEDVFDDPPVPALCREFLADPRHHLAVALADDGRVVGMASGVHYVHPDKPPQMFVNEVGVSAAFEGQGIGKRLLELLFARARELGCSEAWTATEPDNHRAQALYRKAGGQADPTPFVMFTFDLSPKEPAQA
jgi:ribosomal protein S18 acetylase RimI-like enzyme